MKRGMAEAERKSLENACIRATSEDMRFLIDTCLDVYPSLAPHLFYSLLNGLSYDKLDKYYDEIPINRNDFYKYRKIVLEKFKIKLQKEGRWK